MNELAKRLYSPALRMKTGELEGLRHLAPDVSDCVLPRLIIPPNGERSNAMPELFESKRTPDIGYLLAGAWRRPVLVDSSYIMDEFGREYLDDWLPPMFQRAREQETCPAPVALLRDINQFPTGFRNSIARSDRVKFGIRVNSAELIESGLSEEVTRALFNLDLEASDCIVIADFGDADFSEPDIVAPIIGGTLERLQEIGLWQKIVFQGSNFPDKNPAPEDGVIFWPRNEWRAWRIAVNFDPATAEQMTFGDYAADCSKMEFKGVAAKAIRHLRYTAGEFWRIQRGPKLGADHDAMHKVYSRIAGSADFLGSPFSQADAYIAEAATYGSTPHGSAKTWRQLNTTHHITHVVKDIAKVRGVRIAEAPISMSRQPLLLQ